MYKAKGTMSTLHSDLQAGVLTLTLNRPERANAFNFELIEELQAAFKLAASDSQARAILLTGTGRSFSAGQDLNEMKIVGGAPSYREHLLKTYNPLILQIRRIEKPVVAALNGPCAGAAVGLALACDVRVASPELRVIIGFSGIGLVPDSAVSLLLPAIIGLGRAEYYFMTNKPILADEALEWGLVNHVFSLDFVGQIRALAESLAAGPIGAYGLAKQAFNKAVLPNLEEILNIEADLQESAGRSAEHKEGIAAFLEKRKPKFN